MNGKGVIGLVMVASSVLLLAGCATNAESQAVFETCSKDSDYDMMKTDGSAVIIEVTGENARALSRLDDELDEILDGGSPEGDDDGPTSLGVGLTLTGDVDCLIEETNYPGSSDDLQDGDEWDGWKYSHKNGPGSEETYRFIAS